MKSIIKFTIVLAMSLLFFTNLYAQEEKVVYLKNGSILKGKILEKTQTDTLKVQTSDGSVFNININSVDEILNDKKTNSTAQEPIAPNPKYKEPILATCFSFLITGGGQFYNGQVGKGIGYLLWNIGSTTLMYIGIYNMYVRDNYGNVFRSENSSRWSLVVAASAISILASWIASMTDANLSAKKLNLMNGFANLPLGRGKNLSLNPDIKFVRNNSNSFSSNTSLVYGINASISF